MEKDIEKIFNRQFERCKNDLLQVNCPRIFIDCFSKYFDFAKLDVLDIYYKKHDTVEILKNKLEYAHN